jgi:hypothetical protein
MKSMIEETAGRTGVETWALLKEELKKDAEKRESVKKSGWW